MCPFLVTVQRSPLQHSYYWSLKNLGLEEGLLIPVLKISKRFALRKRPGNSAVDTLQRGTGGPATTWRAVGQSFVKDVRVCDWERDFVKDTEVVKICKRE